MRCVCGLVLEVLPSSSSKMHLTFRKKVIGCFLVLLVCLWVIFKTSQLALRYDKLVSALEWEVDRCIHKQGLDTKGRLGPPELYTHYSIKGYPEGLCSVGPAVFEHTPRQFVTRAHPEHKGMQLGYDLLHFLHKSSSHKNAEIQWNLSIKDILGPVQN